MEPEIRYLRTGDGVSIAYYEMGSGVPFVVLEAPYSHLRAERNTSVMHDAIAKEARLIRYDPRGFGLSQRGVQDLSLPVMVRDLEDVADRLKLRRFILYASGGTTSPIALKYAAAHPERVVRLVLYGASARTSPAMAEQIGALLSLPGADWQFVSQNCSRLAQGWEDPDASNEFAALLRECVSMEEFASWHQQCSQWDASDVLDRVITPALVIASKGHRWFGEQYLAPLVAALPDARMAVIEGQTSRARAAETGAAIRAFLGAAPQDQAPLPAPPKSHTAIIMFADIVDSTALTERIGDGAFRHKARELDRALRTAVREHGGEVIDAKTLGDGILATFPAASQAIAAALACAAAGTGEDLP